MVISNFILKIIALIFMTIDHIGVFLPSSTLQFVFRVLGKIALPIFIYTTFEGVRKTKDIKKYMKRLLIMAGFMYITIIVAQLVLYFANNGTLIFQNIFLTLFMLVFSYYVMFINNDKKKKWLISLPIIWFLGSFVFYFLSTNNIDNLYSAIFVDGVTTMYSLEASLMFFLMVLMNCVYESKVKKSYNDEEQSLAFLTSKKAQLSRNIMMGISILLVSLIEYGLTFFNVNGFHFGQVTIYNTYFIISFPFILIYNGKRGFNNKYINGAFYLYYPLHIGIISLLFMLLGGF